MKKLFTLLLSVALVICCIPAAAFAEDAAAPVDLSDSQVTLAEAEYTFTGTAIEPAVTVKLGDKTLSAADYEVTYADNVNVGEATVTIKGKDNYSGSKEVKFSIKAKKFTSSDQPVIEIPTQKQGTAENSLTGVSVTWGKIQLQAETDYDISCDNSKVGTQEAVFTFKGNYEGTISKNYDVVVDSITDAGIYLEDLNAVYTYTGTAYEPAVEVRIGTKVLKEGEDYQVSYENNVNASTSAAPAKIIVTGIGAYSGTIEKTFRIGQARLSDCTVTFAPDAYTVTGEAIVPTYTIKLGDYTLEAEKDFTVTYADNIAVGQAAARFTGKGNFTGTRTDNFAIVAKAVTDLECKLLTTAYDYDGTAKEPAVEVKDGTTVLTAGTDYSVTYEDNINAGTGKAIITGKGVYGGTVALEFTINGKDNKVTTAYTTYTKYLTSKVFNLKAQAIGDQTGFTYTSSNEDVLKVSATGDVTVVGTGKAQITVKTVGTKEYNAAQKVVTVNVKPLKPVVKLSTPAKKQIKVLITKVEGATKYQVRYGRNGKYYYRTITHLDNEFTKTYTTLKKRTSGKTYYIKVRSIKVMEDGTTVYGNWSSTQKIKAK